MSTDTNGARTHEPSLRELTTDLDGLRELLLSKIDAIREILNERDKLYKERDESRRTAVDAALSAAKEQTKQSFDASEKAIVKAEEAQHSYNQSHNDLARKMDDQNKATMPRSETEARFGGLEEKISALKDTVSQVGAGVSSQIAQIIGQQVGGKSTKDETRANIAIALSFLGLLAMLALAAFRK